MSSMMRNFLLTALLSLAITSSGAQDLGSFTSLHGDPTLPPSLLRIAGTFPAERLAQCQSPDGEPFKRKVLKDYARGNEAALRQIIRSGRLLSGDPVSQYLSEVLDVLLADAPELRRELSVYAFRSTAVNAAMMPGGILFINLGLIANTTSEAEIAVVMAHEIVHYLECHSMDLFLDRLKRKWNQGGYVYDYLEYHSRSREQEFEADMKGITQYYLKTRYSVDAVRKAFLMLQYAELPFDEFPLTRQEIEVPEFRLSDSYYIGNFNPIESKGMYTDTLSTHPNVEERARVIQGLLDGETEEGRAAFLLPESRFRYIRDLCRFECINQFLVDGDYVEAWYNARILQRDYPAHLFLDQARAAALYGISRSRFHGQLSNLPDLGEAQGAIHSAVHFFHKISVKEINLLALRETWRACAQAPDNDYLGRILRDLMYDLIGEQGLKINDFSDFGYQDSSYLSEEKADTERLDRYSKLAISNRVIPRQGWENWRFMLADLKREEAFLKTFQKYFLQFQTDQLQEYTERTPARRELKAVPFNVGLLDHPFYLVKKKKGREVLVLNARCSARLARNARTAVRASFGEYTLLPEALANGSIGYDSYALHQRLFSEVMAQSDLGMTAYSSQFFSGSYLNDGTRFVMAVQQFSSLYRLIDTRFAFHKLLTIVQPLYLPYTLLDLFWPVYRSNLQFAMVDTRTGRLVRSSEFSSQEKMRQDQFRDFLYRNVFKSRSVAWNNEKNQNSR
ncbi:MAG TPA: M48 family metallopeptidase [Bacteroidales bacterium]|nr:M48 family metallopeptidase [Bacteroidales bacterium]